jgi:hypothetical protein
MVRHVLPEPFPDKRLSIPKRMVEMKLTQLSISVPKRWAFYFKLQNRCTYASLDLEVGDLGLMLEISERDFGVSMLSSGSHEQPMIIPNQNGRIQ